MNNRITERVTLHFDLNHCPPDEEFSLNALGRKHILKRHTPETLRHHSQINKALALIAPEQQNRITHFVEDIELPADAVGIHLVTYPHKDAHSIPELALPFIHIPTTAKRSHFRRKRKNAALEAHPSSLLHFGITPKSFAAKDAATAEAALREPAPQNVGLESLAPEEAAAVKLDATQLITPFQAAETIIFNHPDLMTMRQDVASTVLYNHISQALNQDDTLPQYLSQHGPGSTDSYYSIVTATNPQTGAPINPVTTDESGQPMVDKDGQPITWPQQNGQNVIQRYKLSPGVVGTTDGTQQGSAFSALAATLQTTKNDPTLNGQLWSVQHGITCTQQSNVRPVPASPATKAAMRALTREAMMAAEAADAGPGFSWNLSNKTSTYGLNVDDSVSYDAPSGYLSFKVKNWANRYLGAYVKFYDEDGNQIGDAQHVRDLPCGNTMCGIPLPTSYYSLGFAVPTTATKADVLLGGMGLGYSDPVDEHGIIFTGVFNYGIPAFLVALSVGTTGARFALDTLESTEISIVIYTVESFLGAPAVIINAMQDPKSLLAVFGEIIAGVIFAQGLQALAKAITGYATTTEILEKVPIVGWAFEILSCSAGIADMLATTVEVLKSPATYTIEVARTIDVQVDISADPTHGTATQAPIWPLESDHWEVILQYQGGTSIKQSGNMDDIKPDTPLSVLFSPVSAAPGAQIRITANFYSKSNWLCGKWVSNWVAAIAPAGSTTLSLKGSIIEFLVPLTAQTQYSHYQKLAFQNGQHIWERTTTAPPEVRSGSTDCPDSGNVLCRLVNITINDLDYALGYTYQASGQGLPLDFGSAPQSVQMYAFQSISALGHPEAEMKQPTVGFSLQPYMAYDQFGPAPLFTMPSAKYQPELDGDGTPEERDVPADVLTAFANAHRAATADTSAPPTGSGNYALPEGAKVWVVTQTAEWHIGLHGEQPLYTVRRETDTLNVFAYPTPAFSPRNFYLDSRSYATEKKYYLRQVLLGADGGGTFDYTSGKNWGKFSAGTLDAIAVHPNGYIVGVNYENHRMLLLQLPASAVDDTAADAPVALAMSGPGLREGLLQGPIALAITPDGRILVLEQDNARIQAFDTMANPVPCFPGQLNFTLDASFKTDLNSRTLSAAFQQAYQQHVEPKLALNFSLPATLIEGLNAGTVTADLKQQFTDNAFALSADGPYQLMATRPGNLWLLMDEGGTSFSIRKELYVNSNGTELFTLPASLIADLNAGNPSAALRQEFNDYGVALSPAGQLQLLVATQDSEWLLTDSAANKSYDITVESNAYVYQGPTLLFSLPSGIAGELDSGGAPPDDLLAQFTAHGVNLSSSLQVNVVTAGASWQLLDSGNNVTYDISTEDDLDVFQAPTFKVEVVAQNSHWILTDTVNTLTFDIKPDAQNSAVLNVQQLVSTMALKDATGADVHYLDIGVETKGFIYVLSYAGTGSQPSDYHLDIYNPDGSWLARTPETEGDPGVNGARFIVDQWRNLYTLNYEMFLGPDNRTEPSVSTWIPSTPVGDGDS